MLAVFIRPKLTPIDDMEPVLRTLGSLNPIRLIGAALRRFSAALTRDKSLSAPIDQFRRRRILVESSKKEDHENRLSTRFAHNKRPLGP
jgi:hypothetical protein